MLTSISIPKFREYNPRPDMKRMHWVRFECSTPLDDKFYKARTSTKWTWLCVLCKAGLENLPGDAPLVVDLDWFATEFVKEPLAVVVADLRWLGAKGLLTIDWKDADPIRSDPIGSVLVPEPIRSTYQSDPSLQDKTYGTERNEQDKTIHSRGTVSGPTPVCPSRTLFDLWNAHCGNLAKVTKLTESRKRKIRARLTEEPDPAYWERAIVALSASSFVNEGGWCTFDWLVKNDTNHTKSGNYPNRDGSSATAVNYDTLELPNLD